MAQFSKFKCVFALIKYKHIFREESERLKSKLNKQNLSLKIQVEKAANENKIFLGKMAELGTFHKGILQIPSFLGKFPKFPCGRNFPKMLK